MGAEPGPEVVGYEDSHEFEGVEPQGEEEIVVDAELQADIENKEAASKLCIPGGGQTIFEKSFHVPNAGDMHIF